MRCAHYLAPLVLLSLPFSVVADPCQDVVEDTVAEIRAGASGWWTADAESLVRTAAGSACIKARSGRYNDSVAQSGAMRSDAVGSSDTSGSNGAAATASKPAEAKAENSDEGAFSVGGITFRSMSGSPSKKPYERAREDKDAD